MLYSTDFVSIIDRDENRVRDGYELRIDYLRSNQKQIMSCDILDEPVNCLEVMVALAIKCENIMMDSEKDNTHRWLWDMMHSLGLELFDDAHFDPEMVCRIIRNFMYRDYEADGEGGLFTIPNCVYDLRKCELWYQAMWYLSYVGRQEVS